MRFFGIISVCRSYRRSPDTGAGKGLTNMTKKVKFFSVFLCAVTLFSVLSVGVFADTGVPKAQNSAKISLSLSGVKNRAVSQYKSVTVKSSEGLVSGAILINGTTYAPTRATLSLLPGVKVTYDPGSRTLYAAGGGLDFSVTDGAYVIFASGRPIFHTSPSVIMSNGRMYSPLSSLAKVMSQAFEEDTAKREASLTGRAKPLRSASEFYDPEAILWLARLIYAESGGESLLGQIAVGGVVMNRVRSPLYPNTIWGVIFDRKYGVQFSPVANGTIYNDPSYTSRLAAMITLEGFRLSEEALFFLEPRISTSHWIPNTRKYLFSVGRHDFYA